MGGIEVGEVHLIFISPEETIKNAQDELYNKKRRRNKKKKKKI